MRFIDYVKADMKLEMALLKEYEKSLASYPEGRLNCKKIRGKSEYYQIRADGRKKHISSDHKALIIALRTKGFIEKAIKLIRRNLQLQQRVLATYEDYDLYNIEHNLPGAYSEQKLNSWMNRYYKMNPYHLEHKIYQTTFGMMVRSRAEVLIAELLHAAQIPFHYDEEIILIDASGDVYTFYVDFVIMTPSGRKIYWEHMGLFTNEEYRKKNFEKIRVFYENGIILSENFIITMDAADGSLSALTIDRIIKGQILPHFVEL